MGGALINNSHYVIAAIFAFSFEHNAVAEPLDDIFLNLHGVPAMSAKNVPDEHLADVGRNHKPFFICLKRACFICVLRAA